MLASERHYCFDFGAREGAAENGHGSLSVDHGRHAKFVVDVPGGAETGNLGGGAGGRRRTCEETPGVGHCSGHDSGHNTEAAHKCTASGLQVDWHRASLL